MLVTATSQLAEPAAKPYSPTKIAMPITCHAATVNSGLSRCTNGTPRLRSAQPPQDEKAICKQVCGYLCSAV